MGDELLQDRLQGTEEAAIRGSNRRAATELYLNSYG